MRIFTSADGETLQRLGVSMTKKPNPVVVLQWHEPFITKTDRGDVQAEAGDYVAYDPLTKIVWPLAQSYLDQHYVPTEPKDVLLEDRIFDLMSKHQYDNGGRWNEMLSFNHAKSLTAELLPFIQHVIAAAVEEKTQEDRAAWEALSEHWHGKAAA